MRIPKTYLSRNEITVVDQKIIRSNSISSISFPFFFLFSFPMFFSLSPHVSLGRRVPLLPDASKKIALPLQKNPSLSHSLFSSSRVTELSFFLFSAPSQKKNPNKIAAQALFSSRVTELSLPARSLNKIAAQATLKASLSLSAQALKVCFSLSF